VEAILAAASYVPLPFLRRNATKYPTYLKHVKVSDVDTEVRVVAVQVFLGHLLSHLKANLNGMDAQRLATKLRETLYEPHMTSSATVTSSDFLTSKEQEEYEILFKYCDAGVGNRDPTHHQAILGKLPKLAIAAAANQVVETLLALGNYEDGGVLEWWLMEYVDDLARWTLGGASSSSSSSSGSGKEDYQTTNPYKLVAVLDEFAERCIGAMTELPEPQVPEKWEEAQSLQIVDIEED
jgi:hypothetical protein